MHKRNPRRMKEVSLERRQRLVSNLFLARSSINRIAHYRAPHRGKMHADLVCSTGMQARFDKRKAAKPQPHSPVGARLAAFTTSRRHPRSSAKIARNRQLDSAE